MSQKVAPLGASEQVRDSISKVIKWNYTRLNLRNDMSHPLFTRYYWLLHCSHHRIYIRGNLIGFFLKSKYNSLDKFTWIHFRYKSAFSNQDRWYHLAQSSSNSTVLKPVCHESPRRHTSVQIRWHMRWQRASQKGGNVLQGLREPVREQCDVCFG